MLLRAIEHVITEHRTELEQYVHRDAFLLPNSKHHRWNITYNQLYKEYTNRRSVLEYPRLVEKGDDGKHKLTYQANQIYERNKHYYAVNRQD